MVIIKSSNARAVAALIDERPGGDPPLQRRVATIVDRVRREGDRALLKYARTFDGLEGPIEIPRREIESDARGSLTRRVRKAIALASRNIRTIAEKQRPRTWTVSPMPGVTIRQRVLPLDRVGCYVPGGRYPLPSSLLMTAIPARVAGVPDVIAVCPRPDPTVMYAALEAGVSRLFRLGGAHAIAALAYGTATRAASGSDRRPGKRLRRRSQVARLARLRDRFLCWTERDRGPLDVWQAGVDRRGPHRAGRARSRRAGDPDHAEPAPGAGRRG